MRTTIIALFALFTTCVVGCKTAPTEADTSSSAKGAPAVDDSIPAPPDVAAPPADAVKTASGLASKILSSGTGAEKPRKWDTVEVNYTGWTTDGHMFDSSTKTGRPARFGLRGVIPGWTEGLQLMVQGEKRRFWIPVQLAYNNRPGKPRGMLVFDIDLVNIIKGKDPIPPPPDVGEPPSDAKKTASGLAYRVLTQGSGKVSPKDSDRVEVDYTGWTAEGEMFDSSVQRGRSASFGVRGVIKGWTEGLQLMHEGDEFRFWIPAELAYGAQPRRPGAPAGQLTFDVELLKIIVKAPPPAVPPDVAAAPKDATKTGSGLAYKHLTRGSGPKPKATDTVEVNYTGWTTDGKMFDSSITRGRPATFPLNHVIKGWTEGLQLMSVGQKTRFWIPADLAYGDKPSRPGAPTGMLVFDVELMKIIP